MKYPVQVNVPFPALSSPLLPGHKVSLYEDQEIHSTMGKWWQPDVVQGSYYMSRTVFGNDESVFLRVINTRFHILKQTFQE